MYHVVNRGSRHGEILRDEEDGQKILDVLQKARDQYGFEIYNFCIMTNHYHFLVRTNDISISTIMKWINQTYTRYFNQKYQYDGPLFKGRFYSDLIDSELKLMIVSAYIALNPVKAHMVADPGDYRWSNYKALIGEEEDPITNKDHILKLFGSGEAYAAFVKMQAERSMDAVSDTEWFTKAFE